MPPKPKRKKPANKSLWRGPNVDGITFSLLSKFCVCRERFRLKVVEGLSEDEGFNHSIEFGSIWHEAEEAIGKGASWQKAMGRYRDKLRARYPGSEASITKWWSIAVYTFPEYLRHWKAHPDETKRRPVLAEESFRVPYLLPSGREIVLRGKWDSVFNLSGLYLMENKTKGQIDEKGITQTVDRNLQTMTYQIALRAWLGWVKTALEGKRELPDGLHPVPEKTKLTDHVTARVKGVLYNVVRRPLSDQHAIKPRKGREVWNEDKTKKVRKGAETDRQFYTRLAGDIRKDSSHYFKRWKVLLSQKDIAGFMDRTFNPILEGLVDWWTWIQGGDPWRLSTREDEENNAYGSPPIPGLPGGGIHWQAPWGVYNSLAAGWRGDFFEFLTEGKTSNLTRVKTLFPELEET